MKRSLSIVVAALVLTACGGGGGGGGEGPQTFVEKPAQPTGPVQTGTYSVTGLPKLTGSDARQMPVYRDGGWIVVGVDPGTRKLREGSASGQRLKADIEYGRESTGVGLDAVRRYLTQVADDPEVRWKRAPVLWFVGPTASTDRERAIRAAQLVNAALPEGRKITIGGHAEGDRDPGIYLEFGANLTDAWGVTHNSNAAQTSQITHSRITVDSAYASGGDRQATILLAHELLHAMGLAGGNRGGHVTEDFDSILEAGRGIYATEQGVQQPDSLLYSADREALRALYSRFHTSRSVASFGPWANASASLSSGDESLAFGVRFANGYAEPWAYGHNPSGSLADNRSLAGSAEWTGALVGFTPDATPVTGDARIDVELSTLRGHADFTSLAVRETQAMWGDGDLGYTISVRGNTFRETGGDAGRLTGIFTGRNHEGAAGTLERTDLTAAFGAKR